MSVLFDYIPTPSTSFSSTINHVDQTNSPSEKPSENLDLKLIETNDDSSIIIGPSDKLINKDELKQNNKSTDKLTKINSDSMNTNGSRRIGRSASSNRRAFALYPNCMSDWDSTDSESGLNESNPNEEAEPCPTRS